MVEFAQITTPMSLSELPSFISQLDTLLEIKYSVDIACSEAKEKVDATWKATTLDSPSFKVYMHSSKQASRPSSIIF